MERIQLAAGKITQADELTIELIHFDTVPAVILFPLAPALSVTNPAILDKTIANTMSVLAQARVRLSQVRAQGPEPPGSRSHGPGADPHPSYCRG